MARKKTEEPRGGAPLWVLTYGDVMSLLLCFFILLHSYSTLELEKFNKAMSSLKGALGMMPYQQSAAPVPNVQMKPGKGERKSKGKRSKAIAALNNVISDNKLSGVIKVSETNNGIHITIGDPALFDTGKDEIKTIIFPVLEQIVEVINTGDENVRVEGHTDNVPIHNDRFKDNWELSIARAMSVIRYIRDQQVIDPRRLRPVGCGEFHPVASNDTQDGRALNRRVEIFIEMGD
jgi:chemotaxis protein MotB